MWDTLLLSLPIFFYLIFVHLFIFQARQATKCGTPAVSFPVLFYLIFYFLIKFYFSGKTGDEMWDAMQLSLVQQGQVFFFGGSAIHRALAEGRLGACLYVSLFCAYVYSYSLLRCVLVVSLYVLF